MRLPLTQFEVMADELEKRQREQAKRQRELERQQQQQGVRRG